MLEKIHLRDFKKKSIEGAPLHYYSFEFDDKELCLEPCLNGFDVALYDNF